METDEEFCKYLPQEQTSFLGRAASASVEARQGEALPAAINTAADPAGPDKNAHVSFKLGESQLPFRLELPIDGNLRDDNNHGSAIRGLASKWADHDSCTSSSPTFAGPLGAKDDAELANVVSLEDRVGGEAASTASQHDTQQDGQERREGPPPQTPSHHSRGLQDAMTLLSTATHDLEGKLNLLLAQHEEDFFTVFRSHMAEVQKHVECLRDCADAQKNLMMRDLKIKTLQKELKWFLEEAARLDQTSGLCLQLGDCRRKQKRDTYPPGGRVMLQGTGERRGYLKVDKELRTEGIVPEEQRRKTRMACKRLSRSSESKLPN
ncbi:hypothetical protein ACSSS7_002985 [Eimeria intestinalis]